ncbi:MAG: hypothetical protein KIT35_25550 [Piscinibacter sp.]|uniref:hypothetical protein n=1 Tax=Piscinibacter TaxID=1114981 RepID=UPI000FDE4A0C|nr:MULTISPECIES: hypothetical protein [Piscinibacter]MCW5667217.1 hypothetical protein [Piscinibacter sp.]
MPCPILLRATAAVLLLGAAAAQAEPWLDADDLQRNGAVSRRLWSPESASVTWGGVRLSAGVALGLRGPLQAQLGRRHTPALTMELGARSSVSLLPGNDGAMLVWQTAP